MTLFSKRLNYIDKYDILSRMPEGQVRAEEHVFFETGQGVRWRGRRWQVLAEEQRGQLTLIGIDPVNEGQVVTPLVALERDALEPDVLPFPELDVEASDRGRWRALHKALLTTMAGGREQLVGLDWGAVTVEPYQLVPLMRVARSLRPRLLIADDTGLGKTAEAGLILRWLAQRHEASRILVVTRAAPEPLHWQRELWNKCLDRILILGRRHLVSVLGEYTAHYNEHRPHRALEQLPPRSQPPPDDGGQSSAEVIDLGRLRRRDRLGGLIHEYQLAA
jgi:hypothetical protein